MTDTQAFAKKYLALWNEPDADRRRRMIAELWTEDGRHILQPPQEILVCGVPRTERVARTLGKAGEIESAL